MILAILLLSSPTVIELYGDRHGDFNKKEDVIYRFLFMTGFSILVWIILKFNVLIAFNLSIAIHFAFFDYIIAYILIKNGIIEPPRGVRLHWFTYVGKSGVVDNFKFWRNMRCGWRFAIRLTYLAVSLLILLTHGSK